MHISEDTVGRVTVALMDGRLDTGTAGPAEATLLALLAKGPLLADLSATRYVSSAGLRILLKAAKQAKASGTPFAVCGLQPAVQEVFEMSGFDSVMAVHANRAAGVKALG